MSKRIKPSGSVLVTLFVAISGVLLINLATTRAQRTTTISGSAARNAAIVATTAEILRETSEIRELEILRPVKSGAQSRVEIERMLVKKLDEQMTRDDMHATEVSLRKFGLVPEDFSYRPFIIKLLTEQVAGYYDAKAREFFIADWLEIEGQKPVISHELTHALQDQHFNLKRFEKWQEGDSDAELAAHALIEGDATLAMTLYMVKNPLVALAFSRSLSGMTAAAKQYNESPRALRDTLVFPYSQGTDWAMSLYKRGGWKAVSNAFSKLPLSTEQILHPEKYVSYEVPVKVRLPDLEDVLNGKVGKQSAVSSQKIAISSQHSAVSRHHAEMSSQNSSRKTVRPSRANRSPARKGSETRHPAPDTRNPARWRRIENDVNGEWSYFLILDQFLNSESWSKRAAAGWAGDRYAIYEEPSTGKTLLTHVSEWDTPNDAEEFFNAYVKRTELRYPGATLLGDDTKNEWSRRWQTSEGVVFIERRGLRVLVIEGCPTSVDVRNLMHMLA